MIKIAGVALGMALSIGVMAQTTQPTSKKEDMKELRTNVRERKAAQDKRNNDLKHVRLKKAVNDQKAVASENKDVKRDARRLKAKGVKDPVTKAKRQNRVQDDNKKDHT